LAATSVKEGNGFGLALPRRAYLKEHQLTLIRLLDLIGETAGYEGINNSTTRRPVAKAI
jgi:hypothetical protein